MNENINALTKACANLHIPYKLHHSSNNLVSVCIEGCCYLFVNWITPLNSESIMKLCQDKDYFFSYYRDVVKMPNTSAFLNPYIHEKYEKYLGEKTIYEIIDKVESKHIYPLVIKKNRGSCGGNVFKVENRRQLEKRLFEVFNLNSALFDYVGLAQDYIEIEKEYRVIFLNGNYQFSYEKLTERAVFKGNLSPLHWEGSTAKLLSNLEEIDRIINLCAPVFKKMMIPFCGLDVAKDKSGEYWLIEANSSPGFDYIVEHEGSEVIIKLYEKILQTLKKQ